MAQRDVQIVQHDEHSHLAFLGQFGDELHRAQLVAQVEGGERFVQHQHAGLALRDTQVTLQDLRERREWKLPYAAIEPPAPNAAARQAEAAPAPAAPRPTRNDFRCGEKVAFEDKYLNTVVGTIVRINERTASIDPGDGTKWRVGFGLLRHVLDI